MASMLMRNFGECTLQVNDSGYVVLVLLTGGNKKIMENNSTLASHTPQECCPGHSRVNPEDAIVSRIPRTSFLMNMDGWNRVVFHCFFVAAC